MKLYKRFFKRGIDITASGLGLLVLSPLIGAVTLWLYFANKGAGAFFIQERPGKDCKPFKVVKFKSMTDEMDENGNLLPNEQRMTKVGSFIRATSIDELPQLWNVFKGDMSLIGPRPLLTEYLPYYTKDEMRRHEVRPGITGMAQLHGRNGASWESRFSYDVWYVDNLSFMTDVKILLSTVAKVLKREDVTVPSNEKLKDRYKNND